MYGNRYDKMLKMFFYRKKYSMKEKVNIFKCANILYYINTIYFSARNRVIVLSTTPVFERTGLFWTSRRPVEMVVEIVKDVFTSLSECLVL